MRTGTGPTDASDIGFMITSRTAGGRRIQRSTLDRGAIERLLRRAMRADRGTASLRRLLGRTHFRPANIHLMTDQEVLKTLTRLVSVGELQVVPTRWWSREYSRANGAGGSGHATNTGGKAVTSSAVTTDERRGQPMGSAGKPLDRPFPPASQQTDPKNWIEFQLVDHQTDEPIANVPFRISLPDGGVSEHTSDGDGMIRIDDLPPGYCDIREIMDKGAFEVVGVA